MSVESTAIKARTKRWGLLNELYQWYHKLRIASIQVVTLYEEGDERDEKAYQQIQDMVVLTTNKCKALEDFLLKEKDAITRIMADENCERTK